MRSRPGNLIIAAVVAAVALLAAAASSPGQTTGYKAPRAPDGRPNLNGIWQAMGSAYWDIEPHPSAAGPMWQLGAAYAIQGGLGIVEGGSIPYTPEARKKKQENFAKRMELDPEMRCYLPGVPRAMYMPYAFQIIQSQKHIMMVFEFAGAVRTIYMAEQTEAPADSWMGWSNGKWEGETLVIDTRGFNGMAWFDRAGNFSSDALHVVERINARSAETLNYEATIEDASVFTKPWKISMPLYRRLEKNAQLMDFKCVEFVEELMYGQWRKKPLTR
jgi:hypothetical protein